MTESSNLNPSGRERVDIRGELAQVRGLVSTVPEAQVVEQKVEDVRLAGTDGTAARGHCFLATIAAGVLGNT